MRRRRYLLACASLGLPLAGCTGDDGEATETEAAAAQNAYEEAFRDALEGEGIEILDLSYDDGVVRLEYVPAEPTEASVEESIEVGARAYFDRVYGGWNADRLDASAYLEGSLVATWHMETGWIDAYLAGEISREELGQRVEDSVERHDDESGGGGDGGSPDTDGTETEDAGETATAASE